MQMMTPGRIRLRNAWNRLPAAERARNLRADPCLAFRWELWARDNQLPPEGEWLTWMLMAGRGFGKSRTGAEFVRMLVDSRQAGRIALVGPTAADARDVMVEGESGLLRIFPSAQRPLYEPSKRRVTFHNGAIATLFSAEEPDRLRGPQHDASWSDEVSSWQYEETWDMLQFGLRLGRHPRQIATTTPKPTRLVRSILADPRTVVTRGTTYENVDNLAAPFLTSIRAKYEGTRLGRQELNAELLTDNPGALWKRAWFDANRTTQPPPMRRIVVAVDPAVTFSDESDETGIVVAGLGEDGRGYVLSDLTCHESPAAWAAEVVRAYRRWGADRIVAEGNNGGDLIESLMRSVDANVAFSRVSARTGKFSRAEPVAALYEQARVSHVGSFPALEDECCDYDPTTAKHSPNHMDALVWALTELMLSSKKWAF